MHGQPAVHIAIVKGRTQSKQPGKKKLGNPKGKMAKKRAKKLKALAAAGKSEAS